MTCWGLLLMKKTKEIEILQITPVCSKTCRFIRSEELRCILVSYLSTPSVLKKASMD